MGTTKHGVLASSLLVLHFPPFKLRGASGPGTSQFGALCASRGDSPGGDQTFPFCQHTSFFSLKVLTVRCCCRLSADIATGRCWGLDPRQPACKHWAQWVVSNHLHLERSVSTACPLRTIIPTFLTCFNIGTQRPFFNVIRRLQLLRGLRRRRALEASLLLRPLAWDYRYTASRRAGAGSEGRGLGVIGQR